MKKIKIALIVILVLFAACVIAKEWQDYTDFTGDLADGDTFLFRDPSDTADDPTYGTVKEVSWGEVREQVRPDDPKCFAIGSATASDDFLIYKNTTGETVSIQNIWGVLLSGTNVIGGLDECDSNGANCSAVDSDITFDGSEDTDDGSLSNSTIDNNDWVRWHTTSVSAPGYLSVCFTVR